MKTTATKGINNNTFAAISRAIDAGIRVAAHKGDLQDAVWAAVKAATGRSLLTIEEGAFAHRYLVSTGYNAPVGFKRDAR
jgi:hypothetical protein